MILDSDFALLRAMILEFRAPPSFIAELEAALDRIRDRTMPDLPEEGYRLNLLRWVDVYKLRANSVGPVDVVVSGDGPTIHAAATASIKRIPE